MASNQDPPDLERPHEPELITYVDLSLRCLPRHSRFRETCIRSVRHWTFEAMSIIVIITYCILQCTYQPTKPDDSWWNSTLNDINLGFQIFFTIEIFIRVCAYGFLLDDGESIAGIRRGCRQLFTKHLRNLLFGTNIIRDAHAAIGPPPLPPLAFNEVNAKPSSPQQASTEQISIVDKQNVSRELSAQLSLVKEEEEDASTNGRADSSLRENNSSTKRNSMKMSSPFENGGMLAAPNGLQTSNLSSGSSRFVRNGSSMVDTTRTQKNIKHVPPLMRDPWGALDVCIVAISWLSFIPGLGNEATAFRALRLLLPLRMLSTLPGMKVGIQSILMSLPMLGNIVLAMAFILSVWTILGMQLFQNTLHQNCFKVIGPNDQPLPFGNGTFNTPESNEGQVCSKIDAPWGGQQCPADLNEQCLGGGASSSAYLGQLNFDNIGMGFVFDFLVMITWWGKPTAELVTSTIGWAYFYSLLLVILGSFFLVNLVLAVLADTYLEQHKAYLAMTQEEQLKDQLIVSWFCRNGSKFKNWFLHPLPGRLANSSTWRWRQPFKRIDSSIYFEILVVLIVLANAIVLGMNYYGMSQTYEDRLVLVNNILAFCFLAEATIKITAQGRMYFMSFFNVFDFIITIASVVGVFVRGINGVSSLRALRALRMLRLLTVIPSMQRFLVVLIKTIILSGSFLVLLLFTMFLFALLGMQLFGGAWEWNAETSPDVPRYSYNSFGDAMLTTFINLLGSMDVTLFQAMYSTSGAAAIYYFFVVLIGNFMVLNLLIALLFTLFNEENTVQLENGPNPFTKKLKNGSLLRSGRREGEGGMAAKLADIKEEGAGGLHENTLHVGVRQGAMQHKHEHVEGASGSKQGQMLARGDVHIAATGIGSTTTNNNNLNTNATKQQRLPARLNSDRSEAETSEKSMDSANTMKRNRRKRVNDPVEADTAARESLLPWYTRLGIYVKDLFTDNQKWKGAQDAALIDHEGNSFFVFGINNPFRRLCYDIVDDFRFEVFVFVVIIVNCGALAVDTPGSSDTVIDIANIIDLACLVVYCIEMVIKLVALNAIKGPYSYFRSPWNILDFIIVVTSVISTIFGGLEWAQALRLLRVLRPLRLISRVREIRAVVTCLYKSLISVLNVVAIAFVLILVFAIIGMEMFMGEFYSCTSTTCCTDILGVNCTTVVQEDQCVGWAAPGTNTTTGDTCEWVNANFNFNNLWTSITSLLVMMSGSDVEDCLLLAWDAVGQGMQPQPENSIVGVIYIIIYVVIGTFFIASLLIGVIIDNYVEEVKLQGHGVMLTDKQREWVDAQRHLLRDRPPKKVKAPDVKWRKWLFAFTEHRLFQGFIGGCIGLNIIAMMMQHYQQSDGWTDGIQTTNNVFTIIFCTESILKLLAQYPRTYFSSGWNIFDFVVSWASFPSIFVTAGPGVNMLRSFRVARLLRLVRHIRSLRRMVASLYIATPIIGNALLLFLLIVFVFAVLGVNLFYGTMPTDPLAFNVLFNWQSVPNAMLMLSIAATGDDPDQYMFDSQVQPPNCILPQCLVNGTNIVVTQYQNSTACAAAGLTWDGTDTCGTPLASLFFVPFMILVSLILINIVIAIVIEAFRMTRDLAGVDADDMEQYRDLWLQNDPDGTGFMHMTQFAAMLRELNQPLGLRGRHASEQDALSFVAHLPGLTADEDGAIYYHEALQALTAAAMDVSLDDLDDEVKQALAEEMEYRKTRQRVLQMQTRRSSMVSGALYARSGAGGLTRLSSTSSVQTTTSVLEQNRSGSIPQAAVVAPPASQNQKSRPPLITAAREENGNGQVEHNNSHQVPVTITVVNPSDDSSGEGSSSST